MTRRHDTPRAPRSRLAAILRTAPRRGSAAAEANPATGRGPVMGARMARLSQRRSARSARSARFSRTALAALTLAAAVGVGVAVTASGSTAAAGGGLRPPGAKPAVELSRAHTGAAGPNRDGRMAFLVIGSDEGAPSFGRHEPAEQGRGDALQLVVLDGAARRGAVIGIPRDSWVPIEGPGPSKINAAMASGGPELMVSTVEELAGISIDYYAMTSFERLITLVNGVGGVPVEIRQRIDDPDSGADFYPGPQRLNGAQALAYGRARKGGVPGGDFGRSRHQGDMLLGGLAAFQGHLRDNPAHMMRWLRLVRENVSTDLSLVEIVDLALFAREFPPGTIHNLVLPGAPGWEGSQSVVHLDPEAADVFTAAREGRFDDLPGGADV